MLVAEKVLLLLVISLTADIYDETSNVEKPLSVLSYRGNITLWRAKCGRNLEQK